MAKAISKIASNVKASTTLAIDAMFKQMKADGIDVVGFGAGEPDFPTPQRIKDAAMRAINEDKTKYTPAAGIIELRQAACDRMAEDLNLYYKPSEVVVASGAKHVLYAALQTLCNPGDEVIIVAPYWVSYSEMVQMVGATPVLVTAGEDADFKVTAQQIKDAITDKTKLVMLNSPSNPTGMIYTKEELRAIADVCVEADIYVMADDIYYKLTYDNMEYVSIAALGDDIRDLCIVVNGVSKTYAMTGWRIGYAMANETIATAMANYLSHSTSAPCTVAQYAALEALSGEQESIEEMRVEFEKRRDHICTRMNAIDGVSCIKPNGAFYIMMNMTSFIGKTMYGVKVETCEDFAQLFLEKGLVATVPLTAFAAPGFVRWSYATSMEEINKGLDRLETFIKNA